MTLNLFEAASILNIIALGALHYRLTKADIAEARLFRITDELKLARGAAMVLSDELDSLGMLSQITAERLDEIESKLDIKYDLDKRINELYAEYIESQFKNGGTNLEN